MKVVVPFAIPAVLLLDITNFNAYAALGEKTFHPGAITSAVGYKNNNPLC